MDSIRHAKWGTIHYRGDIDLLLSPEIPRVAIIGTRSPTTRVLETTAEAAKYLSRCGICIVSGLAIGVDTIAHSSTLYAGGKTVAVPGSAADKVYPFQNQKLADDIVESGGLVASPFEPGTPISKSNFPQRNRLMANMVDAILITGIASMSGTFHAVWEANKLEIPVFAIPTDIKDRLNGTNLLIKKGDARILTDYTQITDYIRP